MIKLENNPAGNFFLLAGPCVIEGEDMAMRIAERVVTITDRLQIPYAFKGSYRKANRSRLDSFTGIGDEKALKILKKVHDTFGVPTVTDIHAAEEAAMAAEFVDILQIPAFLCRQNRGVSSVEISKTGIRGLERYAKKYGIDYAIRKDSSEVPPRYLVFFKAPDAEAFHSAFKEYSASLLNKDKRPSVLARLQELVQAAAELPGKVRHKEQERGL